jgi:hypothetical protein
LLPCDSRKRTGEERQRGGGVEEERGRRMRCEGRKRGTEKKKKERNE